MHRSAQFEITKQAHSSVFKLLKITTWTAGTVLALCKRACMGDAWNYVNRTFGEVYFAINGSATETLARLRTHDVILLKIGTPILLIAFAIILKANGLD